MNMGLIPGLLDEISLQIIARVPRIYYMEMRLVSRSWKAAIMSTELFSVRKKLGTTEEWVYIFTDKRYKYDKFPYNNGPSRIWYCLDPLSSQWQILPLMNIDVMNDFPPTRSLNVHGCASVSVDGCLYVLGGLVASRLSRSAWRYDPVDYRWMELSPMRMGRAYFNAAVLNGKIYVVGLGVLNAGDYVRGGLKPYVPERDELQYVEVFDPLTGVWSVIPGPQPRDEAEITVSIATYKGKLFVCQTRFGYNLPSEIEVVVYDPETNSWSTQMPPAAMFTNWPDSRPACAVMHNERLHALHNYTTNYDNCCYIKVYDEQCDVWRVVSSSFPPYISNQPYVLLASFLGKLHMIRRNHLFSIVVSQYSLKELESEKDEELEDLDYAANDDDDYVLKVIATRGGVMEFISAAHVIDI